MKSLHGWILAIACAAVVSAPVAVRAKDGNSNSTLLLRPDRHGWMLGMDVGEDGGKPYPYVMAVDASSEAKARGIKPGDELIRIDNQEPLGLKNLVERVGKMHAGSTVGIWVRRGTQTMQFELTVPKDPRAVGSDKPADKKDKKKHSGDQANADDKKDKKKDRTIIIKPIPTDQ